MVEIKLTKECKDKFKSDFQKGLFSPDDGRVLKAWTLEMEQLGPKYIIDSKEWRDHALEREWSGYRASCFSEEGRIIYRILSDNTIEVCEIARITPKHDYKR